MNSSNKTALVSQMESVIGLASEISFAFASLQFVCAGTLTWHILSKEGERSPMVYQAILKPINFTLYSTILGLMSLFIAVGTNQRTVAQMLASQAITTELLAKFNWTSFAIDLSLAFVMHNYIWYSWLRSRKVFGAVVRSFAAYVKVTVTYGSVVFYLPAVCSLYSAVFGANLSWSWLFVIASAGGAISFDIFLLSSFWIYLHRTSLIREGDRRFVVIAKFSSMAIFAYFVSFVCALSASFLLSDPTTEIMVHTVGLTSMNGVSVSLVAMKFALVQHGVCHSNMLPEDAEKDITYQSRF